MKCCTPTWEKSAYLHPLFKRDHEGQLRQDGELSFLRYRQWWRLQTHCNTVQTCVRYPYPPVQTPKDTRCMVQLTDIPERAELWDYQELEAAGGEEGLGLGYEGA